MEYLQQHARADDFILSVNNVARGYAPTPERFDYWYRGNPLKALGRVQRALEEKKYAFLVVPTGVRKAFVEALGDAHSLTLSHSDKHFSVYRFRDSPSGPHEPRDKRSSSRPQW